MDLGPRFAKRVFLLAGTYGIVVLPQYLIEWALTFRRRWRSRNTSRATFIRVRAARRVAPRDPDLIEAAIDLM